MSAESQPLNANKDLGKPTDPSLRNGPVVDRGCTDIFCLIFFLLFTIGMFVIAGFAFRNGNPEKLAQPYDPDHRACGVDGGVENFPFIYFANPMPGYLYVTTCVSECPVRQVDPSGSPMTTTPPASSGTPPPASGTPPPASSSTPPPASSSTPPPASSGTPPPTGTTSPPPESSSTPPPVRHHHNKIEHVDTTASSSRDDTSLKCATNSIVSQCSEHIDYANPGKTVIVYNSVPFMGRVCLPTTKAQFNHVSGAINGEEMELMIDDVKTTKWVIFGSIFLAIFLSCIFIFFVEKCAGCIVWTFLLMSLALLLTGAILSYTYYLALTNPSKLPASARSQIDTQTLQENAYANNTNPDNYLYISLTLGSIFIIFLALLICFFSRIKLAVAVLQTAGDFVKDNLSIVLIPILTLVVMILYFVFWIAVALFLYSMGTLSDQPHQLPFAQFTFTRDQKIMGNYHLFGLFWNQAFIIATVEFIIAGSVCIWYFQQGPNGQQTGHHPVRTSIKRFFRYHIGTVAFGSFLLAVISFIRFWLEYLYKNQEQLAKKNKFLEYFLKCMICYLWCFEKCVQFINKNAYICTNMTGYSFCPAAKEAVFLILRNPVRFALVGGFGEIFVAIGRAFIALATGLFCYIIITKSSRFQGVVSHPEAPALLCAIVGFTIGSNFMAIYGIACDAIIFVFCMDEEIERHQGNGKAKQGPPKLQQFLDEQ